MEPDVNPDMNYLPEGSFVQTPAISTEQRVAELERRMNFHRHTTSDRTQPLDKSLVVLSQASISTLTPDPMQADMFILTAQAAALTIANPAGDYRNGTRMLIRITDDGTARAITFGSQYRSCATLPTTTTLGKVLYMGFFFNADETKWDLVAKMEEQ